MFPSFEESEESGRGKPVDARPDRCGGRSSVEVHTIGEMVSNVCVRLA